MVAISTKKKPKLEYVALNIPDGTFTEDDFFEFSQLNDGLKIERLSTGEIIILSLTGGNTGIRNTELTTEFGIWNRQKKKVESLIHQLVLDCLMVQSTRLM